MQPEIFLLLGSILLVISILISKVSHRLGVPTLVFFLLIGMLAGSDGIGGIYFDDSQIAQFLGIFALIIILFSGGLDTNWRDIKPVLGQGILLSTFGVLITTLIMGFFINWLTAFPLTTSLLIGAIISSTDAAAVFSIFKSRKIKLKNNIESTLELESGSNDPMSYFLTVSLIFLITNPETSLLFLVISFFVSIGLGVIFGVISGKGIVYLINKINLHVKGLYPVLTLALAILIFSVTTYLNGNGYLSVYIAALILGNSYFINKEEQIQFFDGIAWLMQIIMFLVLGLLVFPSQIMPIIGIGLLISFFLIGVARPVAVFLCLSPLKVNIKDQIFISWVGIKGAVPIILATYPVVAGISGANMIFNIVFFITLTSALIQGSTINIVARYLDLLKKNDDH